MNIISTPDQEINPVFIVDQEVITQTNSHETISTINLMTSLWLFRIHKGKSNKKYLCNIQSKICRQEIDNDR